VRSNNPEGTLLALRDGSRVEVRSQSNLQIDQAGDGLRLRLNSGSVIVTAAKQASGHLYVETMGAIVSVVGTVFVVSAERTGSRVGVIEGVVNVQQGGSSQKLLRGEQLATNPAMEFVPIDVQVSWSRSVASYLALLQQSVSAAQLPAAAATASSAAVTPPPQAPFPAPSQKIQAPDDTLFVSGNNAPSRGGQRQALGLRLPDEPRRSSTTPDAERAMEQALASRELMTDLSFAALTNYFQFNRAEYFVSITLKIPGAQLTESVRTKRIGLDIFGVITDGFGANIANLRDAVDMQLSDETAKELPARQIAYEAGFTLLPGPYSVKFLIRDMDTGHIGTYETSLVIPNLSREAATNVPISSVVLSSELVSLDNARSSQSATDPLVIEGKKLIPSATRVFSNRRDLIVFLQTYEPNATATEPLTAFVTLYRGQVKVFETPQLTFRDDLGVRWRTLPVTFRVPLANIPVGAYDCQVTVLNPATQKTAVWRSSISVVN